jgi:hypothetical protein
VKLQAFLWMGVLMVAAMAGCQANLFPSAVPRSQFEAYDRSRGEFVERQASGYKGHKEIPLRERLKPHRP